MRAPLRDAAAVAAGAVEARVVRVRVRVLGAGARARRRRRDGVRLQVALERRRQRQALQRVHRRARHDRAAAQLLQAEHCGEVMLYYYWKMDVGSIPTLANSLFLCSRSGNKRKYSVEF